MRRREVLAGAAGGALAGCTIQGRQSHESSGVRVNPVGLAGIVTDTKRTLRTVAEGFRSSASEEPLTPRDLWHIGSNAKAMTAVVYARLVENGVASWGAKMEDLFPSLSMHERWRGTTVEQLMSHTGGLSDEGLLGIWQLIKSELDQRPLPAQRLAMAAKALAAPPPVTRGDFAYSNANYILLGSAIERHDVGSRHRT